MPHDPLKHAPVMRLKRPATGQAYYSLASERKAYNAYIDRLEKSYRGSQKVARRYICKYAAAMRLVQDCRERWRKHLQLQESLANDKRNRIVRMGYVPKVGNGGKLSRGDIRSPDKVYSTGGRST